MKRIIHNLVLALDNFLLKVKSTAFRIRMPNYPNVHKPVQLGFDIKLIGPYGAFSIGEGRYINDAVLAASPQGMIAVRKNSTIGRWVSIKAII